MKAICKNRMITVCEGEVVNYTVENGKFIINEDVALNPSAFFYHFKVAEGADKMTYSDFEYILCNYVFRSAVLFPEEYDGVHHLIIQNWSNSILITINKEETIIRVSFENGQEIYSTYEDALDGIKTHKYK